MFFVSSDIIVEEDPKPLLGYYDRYSLKDSTLLMTLASNLFWIFNLSIIIQFVNVKYIGYHDGRTLFVGG